MKKTTIEIRRIEDWLRRHKEGTEEYKLMNGELRALKYEEKYKK